MSQLEFGYYDPFGHFDFEGLTAAEVYDSHIRDAQEAEKLGYKHYHVIEHQSSPVGQLTEPNVYLTALARETSSIRFGVMIYMLPFHHPLRLAQSSAMLDHLSHGRFDFGVGTGVTPHEFTRWNIPYNERREMSHEVMEIVLQAWKLGEVNFEGKYFNINEALPFPGPFQKPHPPIWFGAHSAASFDYAAEMNFNVAQNIDRDVVIAEKFATWREKWTAFNHAGPAPRAFLTRHVHVAETDEKAREEAEFNLIKSNAAVGDAPKNDPIATSKVGYGKGGKYGAEGTPEREEIGRIFRECARSYAFWIDEGIAIVGSPETVIAKLKEQHELIRHDIFSARHRFGAMSEEVALNSMQLFGKEVIPAFNY